MAASSVDTIFENLGKMTVLELVELKNKIEEEWGITAAAGLIKGIMGTCLVIAANKVARRAGQDGVFSS